MGNKSRYVSQSDARYASNAKPPRIPPINAPGEAERSADAVWVGFDERLVTEVVELVSVVVEAGVAVFGLVVSKTNPVVGEDVFAGGAPPVPVGVPDGEVEFEDEEGLWCESQY